MSFPPSMAIQLKIIDENVWNFIKMKAKFYTILRIYAIYINMYCEMSVRKSKITRQRNYSLDSAKYYPRTGLYWCRRNKSV